MLSITFEVLHSLTRRWNQSVYSSIEDQIDQSIQNLCVGLCIISVIPFTVCYDIGNCYIPLWKREKQEKIEEPEEVPIVLPRRSARLAEKRAKKLL